MKILLEKEKIETLRKISMECFPNEASAILIGERTDEEIIVDRIIESKNILESTTSFEVEPEFLAETLGSLEGTDEELVGFFHSHPRSPAFISSRDKKFMRLWRKKIWMVAGLNKQGKVTEVETYEWSEDSPSKIEIEVA